MNRIIFPLLLLSCMACRKDKNNQGEPTLTGDAFLVSAGGKSTDLLNDMYTNSDGATWITGKTQFTPIFDTAIYFGNNQLKGVGGEDVAIARYDKHGNVLWAKITGSQGWDEGEAIVADNNNNCYVAGVFSGKIRFDDTELTPQVINNSSGMPNLMDMFLTKYDPQGKVLWAKQIRGVGYERPTAVALDKTGNLVVTGYYHAKIQFEETLNPEITSFERPGSAFFIAKYTPAGNLLWAKSVGKSGGGSLYPCDIKLDPNDNIFITGSFEGTQDFGGTTLQTNGDQDVFTAKFDNAGNIQWARSFGSTSTENSNALVLDKNNNIFIGGLFRESITIGSTTITASPNSFDAFFAKLDANGNIQWLKNALGDGEEGVQDMVIYNDSLYLVGYYTRNLTIEHYILHNEGWGGFVTRHSLDGKVGAFRSFTLNTGIPKRMYMDAAGSSVIGSYFHGGIYIDKQSRNSRGSYDMLLWKSKLTFN